MPIDFRCPQCDKAYQAPDHLAGKTIRCRACNGLVSLPGGVAAPTKPPSPSNLFAPPPGVTKLGAKPTSRSAAPAARPQPQPQRAAVPPTSSMPAASLFDGPAAAPFGALPQQYAPASSGGGNIATAFFEGLLGLVLLVAGGGMYWAYSSFTERSTLSQRRTELLPARQPSTRGNSASDEEARRKLEARIAEVRAELEARKARQQGDAN